MFQLHSTMRSSTIRFESRNWQQLSPNRNDCTLPQKPSGWRVCFTISALSPRHLQPIGSKLSAAMKRPHSCTGFRPSKRMRFKRSGTRSRCTPLLTSRNLEAGSHAQSGLVFSWTLARMCSSTQHQVAPRLRLQAQGLTLRLCLPISSFPTFSLDPKRPPSELAVRSVRKLFKRSQLPWGEPRLLGSVSQINKPMHQCCSSTRTLRRRLHAGDRMVRPIALATAIGTCQ